MSWTKGRGGSRDQGARALHQWRPSLRHLPNRLRASRHIATVQLIVMRQSIATKTAQVREGGERARHLP